MYTKGTLFLINDRYCKIGKHWISDGDVEKANRLVDLIESTRSKKKPKPGDILCYTDSFGGYYSHAHIEKVDLGYGGNICKCAYVPFISEREDGIRCSTSGGPWTDVAFSDMKYVGKEKKRFCFWGSCGACADGAIEIEAEVSVWEYAEPKQETPGYTTKFYNQFFLSDSGANSKYTRESGYRYHVSSGGCPARAFKTKEELDAWLTTFKGKVFDRGERNSSIVWTWKQREKHVSPAEFDSMPEPVDTMLFNGAVRKCKRVYDEDALTVTTCFVWYWHEEGDFYKTMERQNKIREERYTLPWNTPEYAVARGIAV